MQEPLPPLPTLSNTSFFHYEKVSVCLFGGWRGGGGGGGAGGKVLVGFGVWGGRLKIIITIKKKKTLPNQNQNTNPQTKTKLKTQRVKKIAKQMKSQYLPVSCQL